MSRAMAPASRPRGFTLVELLVVIAIIAVLAAMIFPVLAKTQGKARQAHCLSNIKQLATALLIYAGDYDDCMPPAMTDAPGSQFTLPWDPVVNIMWWDTILPYLSNNVAVMHCPAVKSYTPVFFMNTNLAVPPNSFLGSVTDPSDTILITERQPLCHPEEPMVGGATTWVTPLTGPFHHFDKMNVAFVDGHAKALGPASLDISSPLWLPVK